MRDVIGLVIWLALFAFCVWLGIASRPSVGILLAFGLLMSMGPER